MEKGTLYRNDQVKSNCMQHNEKEKKTNIIVWLMCSVHQYAFEMLNN